MICFPNAKINLGLFIVEKREDGYHNLQTLMVPTGPKDILEFMVSGEDSFHLSGNINPIPDDDNIVVKARDLIRLNHPIPPLKIYLHKAIPAGAGLGGGSSDAAFFLKEVNSSFNLGISTDKLRKYAEKLGSDCAFFIENKPAYVWSKGEKLEHLHTAGHPYYLYLFYPGIHISTKEAYSQIQAFKPEKEIRDIIQSGIANWKGFLVNDFEKGLFKTYPVLAGIKELLYRSGALYASMSGSGSSIYGIFEEKTRISADDMRELYPAKKLWEGNIKF